MNRSQMPENGGVPSSRQRTALDLAELSASLPDAITVGSTIGGKYKVERVVGAGAMGIVLACRHVHLDELVALKFIRPEMQAVPGVLSRFAREAKACVRIKSDHIANVLDVGTAPGIGPYIVMEYLEGRDLAAVLAAQGPLPIQRATEYVMQACEALALAHANGITHRDIKPSNLFVSKRGNLEIVKVLDFGISKAALTGDIPGSALNQTTATLGTPLYMSPEQIRASGSVDHRADIWSLGVVLYELLTGQTAFVADSLLQVCALVLEGTPPALSELCPAAPPGLQAVVSRCLAKSPEQRFAHVAELAQALVPFASPRAAMHADRASSVLQHPVSERSDVAGAHSAPNTLPAALPESETQLAAAGRQRAIKYAPFASLWIGAGIAVLLAQLLWIPHLRQQQAAEAAAAATEALESADLGNAAHTQAAETNAAATNAAETKAAAMNAAEMNAGRVPAAGLAADPAAPASDLTQPQPGDGVEAAAPRSAQRSATRTHQRPAPHRQNRGSAPLLPPAPASKPTAPAQRPKIVAPDRRVDLLQ